MSITPKPRFTKINWLSTHNEFCKKLSLENYSTLLIGDSIIAALPRYTNVWKSYFNPLNAINCGIGGDRVEHVLWRCNNLPPTLSLRNVIIMCGTNNIDYNSPDDIVDGILDIVESLRRNFKFSNIVIYGILPRNDSWSVNRLYIKEINDLLRQKCKKMISFSLNQ